MSDSVNDYDYVQCKICGKWYKKLGLHTLKIHGITTKEYRRKFPGAPTTSRAYDDKMAPVYVNGGLSLIRKHGQKFFTQGKLNSQLFHDMKSKQLHDMLIEEHKDPEWERKLVRAAIGSHKGLMTYTTKSGKEVKLRSTWELIVYDILENCEYEFEFEPFPIQYELNGKVSQYFPDFYVPELNLIIEVKPDCFTDYKYTAKRYSVIHNGYNFFHVGDEEIRNPTIINEALEQFTYLL